MPVKSPAVLVIHGPNLNLLGRRERDVYGTTTLAEINAGLKKLAGSLKIGLALFQSNHEGAIVDRIHAGGFAGILINPAGLTHTSVTLRDALLAAGKPVVEVHLTNIHAREDFRKTSLVSDIAAGVVCGFGPLSYELGLQALDARLRDAEVAPATHARLTGRGSR